jgi:hypothetical protein
VPDNLTWCKIFRSFKGRAIFYSHTIRLATEGNSLIATLVVFGYVDLAFEIWTRTQCKVWQLEEAMQFNGSKHVYFECSRKFSCLRDNWLFQTKQDGLPLPPLFSLELAKMTSLWNWFLDDTGNIYHAEIVEFILLIGEYRSTVALDFLLSSCPERVFRHGWLSRKTLRRVLGHDLTLMHVGRALFQRTPSLRQIYESWNDPKAKEFLADFINPVEEYIRANDSSE